jgi:hypothetical protein
MTDRIGVSALRGIGVLYRGDVYELARLLLKVDDAQDQEAQTHSRYTVKGLLQQYALLTRVADQQVQAVAARHGLPLEAIVEYDEDGPGNDHCPPYKPEEVSMTPIEKDPEREDRLRMEIIVDAYGPEEQAMGWYYYLESTLTLPFTATCITERAISPLRLGDEVDILRLAPESECQHEMFVETPWDRRTLAIPLSQVKPISATDEQTKEAVADWHYWVARGYEL